MERSLRCVDARYFLGKVCFLITQGRYKFIQQKFPLTAKIYKFYDLFSISLIIVTSLYFCITSVTANFSASCCLSHSGQVGLSASMKTLIHD